MRTDHGVWTHSLLGRVRAYSAEQTPVGPYARVAVLATPTALARVDLARSKSHVGQRSSVLAQPMHTEGTVVHLHHKKASASPSMHTVHSLNGTLDHTRVSWICALMLFLHCEIQTAPPFAFLSLFPLQKKKRRLESRRRRRGSCLVWPFTQRFGRPNAPLAHEKQATILWRPKKKKRVCSNSLIPPSPFIRAFDEGKKKERDKRKRLDAQLVSLSGATGKKRAR